VDRTKEAGVVVANKVEVPQSTAEQPTQPE
jgi:hypothetical protein